MINICLICIGSNYNQKKNFLLAHQKLHALFPDIRFAKEEVTKPLWFRNQALFTDQVAVFSTIDEEWQVKAKLKDIEHEAGRHPEDKLEEKVCLDIDLLIYDGKILKPDDLKREYIQKGIEELDEDTPLYYVKYLYHRSYALLGIDKKDVIFRNNPSTLCFNAFSCKTVSDIGR